MTLYDVFSASKRNTPEGKKIAENVTAHELAHNYAIVERTVETFSIVLNSTKINNHAGTTQKDTTV